MSMIGSLKKFLFKKAPVAPAPVSNIKINPEHLTHLANFYHNAPHNPSDPKVKRSYDALIHETKQQYKTLLNQGYKFSKMKAGQKNPYPTSSEMHHDVENNMHLHYFPTSLGFGSDDAPPADHPMLQPTEFKDSEGQPMLANDVFRQVHDVFGHVLNGKSKFGAKGEYQAFLNHKSMYSPAARSALASETLLQNSYVHAGPHAEYNKQNPTAPKFAPQKAVHVPEEILNNKWHIDNSNMQKSIKSPSKHISADRLAQIKQDNYIGESGQEYSESEVDYALNDRRHAAANKQVKQYAQQEKQKAFDAENEAKGVGGANPAHFPFIKKNNSMEYSLEHFFDESLNKSVNQLKSGDKHPTEPRIARFHAPGIVAWYSNSEQALKDDSFVHNNKSSFLNSVPVSHKETASKFIESIQKHPKRHAIPGWDPKGKEQAWSPRIRHIKHLINKDPNAIINYKDDGSLDFTLKERHGENKNGTSWNFHPQQGLSFLGRFHDGKLLRSEKQNIEQNDFRRDFGKTRTAANFRNTNESDYRAANNNNGSIQSNRSDDSRREPNTIKKTQYTDLNKGLRGDWQKEGYKLDISHSSDGKEAVIHAFTGDGKEAGRYHFTVPYKGNKNIHVFESYTHAPHRRKGIANSAYKMAEQHFSGKILPTPSQQTDDAKALWNQPQKPFGKADVSKGSPALKKMSRPRITFPNLKQVSTRPDQDVQLVETGRQKDLYGRKVANAEYGNKQLKGKTRLHGSSKIISNRSELVDVYGKRVASQFDRNVLGLNHPTPQGPKSAALAGKMRSKYEEGDEEYAQKVQAHKEKRNQIIRNYNQSYRDWQSKAYELSNRDLTNPDNKKAYEEHRALKPEKPKLPRAPSKKAKDTTQLSPEQAALRGRAVEGTVEHEGFHNLIDQIATHYGPNAAIKVKQKLIEQHHPEAIEAIGNFIVDTRRYKRNSPSFGEEILTHSRDLLVNPKKREEFKRYIKNEDLFNQHMKNIKIGHEKAYKVAQSIKPEDITTSIENEKMAASEPVKESASYFSKNNKG